MFFVSKGNILYYIMECKALPSKEPSTFICIMLGQNLIDYGTLIYCIVSHMAGHLKKDNLCFNSVSAEKEEAVAIS